MPSVELSHSITTLLNMNRQKLSLKRSPIMVIALKQLQIKNYL